MNPSILRLFGVVVVLFVVLVGATSWWTVFGAEGLRDNPDNRRELLAQARIERGLIRAENGRVLARSVEQRDETFRRTYPTGSLFGHAVGYSFITLGQAGLEKYRNGPLTGERQEFASILDQLSGKRQVGDNVTTTLDPEAQQTAFDALGGQKGAVVALEPSTGRIRVMASEPRFDPNDVPEDFRRLSSDRENSPLLNRATQSTYPPGSTFKVVTASAAIDSGKFTPDSTVNGNTGVEISGVPLQNSGGVSFGQINLTTALTFSVNTVWAQVGEALGKETMGEYMTRFGFYSKPPLDYPADQITVSGSYSDGKLLSPTSDEIDVGRMAIGQDKLAVTPLQMAQVAAAVANRGTLVKPRLTRRIVDPDGRTVDDIEPSEQSDVMKPESAEQVKRMMAGVVREGTGTAAALSGIEVAGKTGTAEIDPAAGINQVWFIGFAPVDDPKIAIAVTVERSTGEGGQVAAPIARQVLERLL